MRIAWVLYGGLDQPTGGTVYDRLVVQGLLGLGFDVRVISLTPRGRARGVLASGELVARLDATGADVVVGDELCFAELGGAFARRPGRPRVLLVHHLSCWEPERAALDRLSARVLEDFALRLCDRIIATSHATADRLRSQHSVAGAHVVHPGSDRLPRGRKTASDRTRLLFVGTWTPRKGLLRLLTSLETLPTGGWSLTIVGDATRDAGYAALVRAQLARMERCAIDVRGQLDDDDLAAAYAAHDVLVLPTSFEGFGMVVSEALYMGLDVLTTRTPATEEASFGSSRVSFVDGHLADALRAMLARVRPEAPWDARDLPTWENAVAEFAAVLGSTLRAAR